MIERLLIKDLLSFKNVELEFDSGLIVFSGASGTGKSILMRAIISLFGHGDSEASLVEAVVNEELELEELGVLQESPNILKCVKQKSTRYFINSQMVPKKGVYQATQKKIKYLNAKESDELSPSSLLKLLDSAVSSSDFKELKKRHKECFINFSKVKKELEKLENEERQIEELKEFAKFEIEKIKEINPQIDEDEKLMNVKKMLSKKEKLQTSLELASRIFDFESAVFEALSIAGIDGEFFSSSMNELRAHLESASMELSDLDEVNVEELLDRIELISDLKRRYGGIKECLEYLEKKVKELAHYENISFEKDELTKLYKKLKDEVEKSSLELTKYRKEALPKLEKKINSYLNELYLNDLSLSLNSTFLSEFGVDEVVVSLKNVSIKDISSGELNRVRLAFLATTNEFDGGERGVLLLDEIDANLSGKEAMSIAKVLTLLSKNYQIFAISHQPQLSSKANEHFLVQKSGEESSVKKLSKEERLLELARMVSGEKITIEAKEFANSLLSGVR